MQSSLSPSIDYQFYTINGNNICELFVGLVKKRPAYVDDSLAFFLSHCLVLPISLSLPPLSLSVYLYVSMYTKCIF